MMSLNTLKLFANKKYITVLIFGILISFSNCFTQNATTYALQQNGPSQESYYLVETNLHTGQNITLHLIDEFHPGFPVSRPIINPVDSTYNILAYGRVGQDTSVTFENAFIYSIHIPSGQVERTPVSKNSIALEYSCSRNLFYFLTNDVINETVELYSFDPSTNAVTYLSTFTNIQFTNNTHLESTAFNSYEDHLYFQGSIINGIPSQKSIFTIDVNSGAIVNTYNIPAFATDDIHQMAFSYQDSSLYALKVKYNPNERSLVKIDLQTWSAVEVSGAVKDFWYTPRNVPIILPSTNQYYIVGFESSGSTVAEYHTYELGTGLHNQSPSFFLNNSYGAQYIAKRCMDRENLSTPVNDELLSNVEIFPNPSKGKIAIRAKGTIKSISVHNSLGKRISENVVSNEKSYQIELPKETGIYYIQVVTNQTTINKTIIRD